MLQICLAKVINLPSEIFLKDKDISLGRKQKTMQYKRPNDQIRSLGAEALLVKLLKLTTFPYHFPLEFKYNDNQKPQLNEGPYQFNLSHSGDYVMCGISDTVIGVDVEQLHPITETLIKKVLSNEELTTFNTLSQEKQINYFYTCWTIKEAYFKALGIGIKKELLRLIIINDDEKTVSVNDFQKMKFCSIISNGHICSACHTNNNNESVEIKIIEL